MKMALALILLAALQANAQSQNSVALRCIPAKPCAYAETANSPLRLCVRSIELEGTVGKEVTETIRYRHQNIEFDLLIAPDQHTVSVTAAQGTLSFQEASKSQYGTLHLAAGGTLQGSITVDRFAQFEVTCSARTTSLKSQ